MSDIHEIGQEIVEGMRRKGYSEEMIEALVDEKVWEENRTPPPELLSSPSPHTAILSPCCSCALEARLRTPICRQYRCLCCDKFYIWSPGHWESA